MNCPKCSGNHWLLADQAERPGSMVPRTCAECGHETELEFSTGERKPKLGKKGAKVAISLNKDPRTAAHTWRGI